MRALKWRRCVKAKGNVVPVQPRLLIIAKDERLFAPLAEGLDRLGWHPVMAGSATKAAEALTSFAIEAVIIDLSSSLGNGIDDTMALARRLKSSVAPRRLPVIAVGTPDALVETPAFDLVLSSPLHPSQAALRIETLVRTAIADEEFELRQKTFAERGKRLDRLQDNDEPLRVLAIGEPAPQFLALSNMLARHGADVVGAFTAYTAFDYLHERTFDAVVMWGGANASEVLSIAGGMRRNTRLYHIPVILCLAVNDTVTPTEAFNRGVSDVATSDVSVADTANRVVELARAYRRQTAIRSALDKARASGLMDAATGLFTRDLFAAHLLRLSQASAQFNRPLSVCVLRVADRPEVNKARSGGWMERALPQIGSMIGRLVRSEDTAARIAPEVFALALPASSLHEGHAAAERIAAVIACTAFDAGVDRPPFVAEFNIGVAQLEANESAASALERAAAKALRPEQS